MSDQTPNGPDADGTTPPPPPPGSEPWNAPGTWAAGTTPDYAGLPKRFLARVLDGLIVGIPLGIILIVLAGLDATGPTYAIATAVVNVAYFVFLESTQGATLGKRVLGLSVRGDGDGGTLTPEAAFRRNWWLLLGLLPVIGGLASLGVTIYILVTISSDARNRGWHDKLAGAVVLDR